MIRRRRISCFENSESLTLRPARPTTLETMNFRFEPSETLEKMCDRDRTDDGRGYITSLYWRDNVVPRLDPVMPSAVASPVPQRIRKTTRIEECHFGIGMSRRPVHGLESQADISSPRLCVPNQAASKRSWFITLVHAATKSFANFSLESAHA